LAFKGFGVFPGYDANLPTQLWIAFRYVFSLSVLIAPAFITRRINASATLIVFAAISVLLFTAIFSGFFPDCFIEGTGLTPFKVFSEYIIIIILFAALGLLVRKRTLFDPRVLRMLAISIVSAVAAEAAFTRYLSVYGLSNLVGHLFLFISAVMIYRAIVVTGIEEPAAILFRNLERSEERFRLIAETSVDLIFQLDLSGTVTFCSPAVIHYGYRVEDVIGKDFSAFIVPADLGIAISVFMRANGGERINAIGLRLLMADGSSFNAEINIAPTVVNGDVIGLHGISRDVTERKQSEQALMLAKEEWERTFNSLPDMIAILDDQHRIIRVNESLANTLNLEPSQCSGMPCYEVMHGTNAPPAYCPHTKTLHDLSEKEALVEENVNGGSYLVSTTPIFDHKGDFFATVHVARDVTGLKQVERALRENEERLRLFIEHAPVALAMFDRDMRYLCVSHRWLSDYGLLERDLTGVSHYEVFPEMSARWKEAHRRGLAGEVLREEADRFERDDGSVHWLRWEIRPWYDTAGEVSGIVIFVEDITQRKRTEEGLQKTTADLQAAVVSLRESRLAALDLMQDTIEAQQKTEQANIALQRAHDELEQRVSERTRELAGTVNVLQAEIIEREKAEAALRKSAREIEDLYNLAPCGYHSLDKDGTFVRINDTELKWLGYDRDEVVGKLKVTDIQTPESCAEFSEIYPRFLQGGGVSELRISYIRKDGSILPVLLNATAVLDDNGDYLMSRTTAYDITDLVQAEENVRKLNLLYLTLSETGRAIASLSDRDELFQGICRTAVECGGFRMVWIGLLDEDSGRVKPVASFGYGTDYLDNVGIFVHPEAMGVGPTGTVIRCGGHYICNDFMSDPCTVPWQSEAKKQGFLASAAFALTLNGVIIGAITIYAGEKGYFDPQKVELLMQMQTDISFAMDNLYREDQHRKAEQALREETLQRLHALEALRVQEHIMIQQNRHAIMGEMIGNIAHQWRQPLNSLGLYTQSLGLVYGSPIFNKEFLEASVAKSMEIIQHMSSTIDDFRNFFSTEREKSEFRAIEAIIKVMSLVEASFKEHGITIAREEREDVKIYGYPNEYAQVLINILINAKDALVERTIESPRIKISISSDDATSLVTIADNAGGIPEAIVEKIFDPYFTTKGPQQGTGVGLFMSKAIIENKMGGKLTVRNTDVGAEFRIEVNNGEN
jgi:PAS domain S-box-containing protein